MPTLTQVRNRANTWLADRWPAVQARQEAYFATHGRYWQGLRCMVVEPSHSDATYGDAVADRLTVRPTDQTATWLDVLPELDGVAIPAVLTMDVYQAPDGHGYVATVAVRYNGVVYSRAQNVGPEDWRTVAWHVVSEETP